MDGPSSRPTSCATTASSPASTSTERLLCLYHPPHHALRERRAARGGGGAPLLFCVCVSCARSDCACAQGIDGVQATETVVWRGESRPARGICERCCGPRSRSDPSG